MGDKTTEELKLNIEDLQRDLMQDIPRDLDDSFDRSLEQFRVDGLIYNTNVRNMLADYKNLIAFVKSISLRMKLMNSKIREIANVKK